MDLRRGNLIVVRFGACLLFLPVLFSACRSSLCRAGSPPDDEAQGQRRKALVQLLRREISDSRVLAAMEKVPRHRFVPEEELEQAYRNYPLPIGEGQTISQPFIVAYMTQGLKLSGREKVLEIGTGSGYQAAILAETAAEVFSVEILPVLSTRAAGVLRSLGYANVHLRVGDGFEGWPEHAPYDAILVTAAPLAVPLPLEKQLKEGGRLVIPIGREGEQTLLTYVKRGEKLVTVERLPVRFVPMTGKALR